MLEGIVEAASTGICCLAIGGNFFFLEEEVCDNVRDGSVDTPPEAPAAAASPSGDTLRFLDGGPRPMMSGAIGSRVTVPAKV